MFLAAMLFGWSLASDPVGVPPDAAVFFGDQALKHATTCPGIPKPRAVISAFEARWFTDIWRAAGERPLSERQDTGGAAWRFTTLPTWGPPVIVRIEEDRDGVYIMVAKRLSGQGGYEPGHVAAEMRRQLLPDEARTFREQLERFSPLWAEPRDCRWGTDGTVMIFETAGASGYQVAQRWSPEGGPMRSLAEVVVSFTGWGKAVVG